MSYDLEEYPKKEQSRLQSGASYLLQGFEDNVLGSSPG